jgi:hypothetical protein
MGYQSEAELEKQLVEQSIAQGYGQVKIANEEGLIDSD